MFVLIMVASLALAGYFVSKRPGGGLKPLDARRLAVLTGATEIPEKVKGPFPYWRFRRGDQTFYAAESLQTAPDVVGYGGPFNLVVVLNAAGEIDRVVVAAHRETPSYLVEAREFLRSFRGLPADAPLAVGSDIDAMTRATVSSEAFAAAARLTARRLANAALARNIPVPAKRTPWDWEWLAPIAFLYIIAVLLRRKPSPTARYVAAAVVVVVLGFWAGRFISFGDVARFGLWQFPPVAANATLYLLLAGALITSVAFGNVYCGWLCPFGAASELIYKLPTPKVIAPVTFARRAAMLRLVFLVGGLSFIIAQSDAAASAYEPFDDLFARSARGWSLIFLIVVLVVSVFHYRFFCRYLCAVGCLWGEVTAVGFRPVFGPGADVKTGGGFCPTGALGGQRADFEASLCIECGRCRAGRNF